MVAVVQALDVIRGIGRGMFRSDRSCRVDGDRSTDTDGTFSVAHRLRASSRAGFGTVNAPDVGNSSSRSRLSQGGTAGHCRSVYAVVRKNIEAHP